MPFPELGSVYVPAQFWSHRRYLFVADFVRRARDADWDASKDGDRPKLMDKVLEPPPTLECLSWISCAGLVPCITLTSKL